MRKAERTLGTEEVACWELYLKDSLNSALVC